MKLGQLVAQFRRDTDDTREPFLWSPESVVTWLNEAEREACTRAQLLIDSSTAGITPLVTVADNAFVAYDQRIVRVLRARPRGRLPVQMVTAQEMDVYPNWEDETGTELRALITDMATYKLRTYPVLTAPATLDLTVQRLPMQDMTNQDEQSPEIQAQYHLHLVEWAKYRAYSMPDEDANDPKRAAVALGRFEAQFGRTSAKGDAWMRQHGGRDLMTGHFA